MEFNNRIKGQTTIEFMIIVLIALVYLQAVILPGINHSSANLQDAQRVTQAKIEAQKIANAIEEVSLISGSAKKQVLILIPEKTAINVPNDVNIIVTLTDLKENFSKNWANANCTKAQCVFNVPYYKAGLTLAGKTFSNTGNKSLAVNVSITKVCAAQCGINVQ